MLDTFEQHLSVIISLITLIVMIFGLGKIWGSMNSRMKNNERETKHNYERIKELEKQYNNFKIVQNDVSWIKQSVDKIVKKLNII